MSDPTTPPPDSLAPGQAQVLGAIPGPTALAADRDLACRQRERLPVARARAQAKVAGLAGNGSAQRLLRASQGARTAPQRVVWLQRAASAWARPFEAVGACRRGCAHCCHIPVTISSVEAELLARAAARPLSRPAVSVRLEQLADDHAVAAAQALLQGNAAGVACPFLQEGACSVYEQRPIACRTLVNLDDDELLCRHASGEDGPAPASVPYADAGVLKALALAAQAGAEFADIRGFFPQPDAGAAA